MIVIIGASASGKTEISKILIKNYNYKKLITTTTRNLRPNERNHIDYHFVSKDEFLKGLKNNEFLEHTIYNNNYYGINKKDVNKNALVIVDPNGANVLIDELKENSFVVYVKTNKRIRKSRMLSRKDDPEVIKERLKNDDKIFKKSNIKKIDLVLKNNKTCINELAKKLHEEYVSYQEKVLNK